MSPAVSAAGVPPGPPRPTAAEPRVSLGGYLHEVVAELRKTVWRSSSGALRNALVVIAMLALVTLVTLVVLVVGAAATALTGPLR